MIRQNLKCECGSLKNRSRQDSNLRGETPMDFKSIALTTRPQLPRCIVTSENVIY